MVIKRRASWKVIQEEHRKVRLVSLEEKKRFEKATKRNKNFIVEKGINFGGPWISESIDKISALGWRWFGEGLEVSIMSIVREFNANVSEDVNDIIMVREMLL